MTQPNQVIEDQNTIIDKYLEEIVQGILDSIISSICQN